MIKCCMFDLDGTLLSTLTTITHYVNKTFQKYDILPITEDECKYFVGDGARKLIARALKSRGAADKNDEIYGSYLKEYDTDPYYLTEPYSGIPELIKALKDCGVALAVISNKQDSSTRLAINHFFGDDIDITRGGIDGIPLKPDPAAPLDILSTLGISPRQTVYVGDTGVDMETGGRMGAALTVGVLWGFRDKAELEAHGADIIASSPADILSEVLKINKTAGDI